MMLTLTPTTSATVCSFLLAALVHTPLNSPFRRIIFKYSLFVLLLSLHSTLSPSPTRPRSERAQIVYCPPQDCLWWAQFLVKHLCFSLNLINELRYQPIHSLSLLFHILIQILLA